MPPDNVKKSSKLAWAVFFGVLAGAATLYYFAFAAPAFRPAFGQDSIVVQIEPGQSLRGIAKELAGNGIVKSAGATQALMVFFGGERNVKAGVYVFKKKQNAITVAKRIVGGDYGYIPVKLTVPEGTNSEKLAEIIHSKFPSIEVKDVLAAAKSQEGYLFPETYFFAPVATVQEIIKMMAETFTEKIKPYEEQIRSSGRSTGDIIKMASILEAEVQTDSDRKMVADLLWRRIKTGMALQVDSTLGYVLNKTSAELTISDLKSDNPYNTYTHKGLPPTPISNPGEKSIEAALNPTPNEYLFYLSDNNGITHFAETYAEHLLNKKKYIK